VAGCHGFLDDLLPILIYEEQMSLRSSTRAPQRALDATVVDAASLFDAGEFLSEQFSRRVTVDYPRLKELLDRLRLNEGWRPADRTTILVSWDPNSEGQRKFHGMLQHADYETDVSHYRDSFASLPPGRTPGEFSNSKPLKSFAARLAYISGLMARYPESHFLVVTHSFELFSPLTDLARRFAEGGHGKAGIAYFGTLMDYRWKSAGLFEQDSPIKFFDLDKYGQELVGFELLRREQGGRESQAGLSRF
jgi:hypothetical protein